MDQTQEAGTTEQRFEQLIAHYKKSPSDQKEKDVRFFYSETVENDKDSEVVSEKMADFHFQTVAGPL